MKQRHRSIQIAPIITALLGGISPTQCLFQLLLGRFPIGHAHQTAAIDLIHHLLELFVARVGLGIELVPMVLHPLDVFAGLGDHEPGFVARGHAAEDDARTQRVVLIGIAAPDLGQGHDAVPCGQHGLAQLGPVLLRARGPHADVRQDVVAGPAPAADVGVHFADVGVLDVDEHARRGEFARVDRRDGLGQLVLLCIREGDDVLDFVERHVFCFASAWFVERG